MKKEKIISLLIFCLLLFSVQNIFAAKKVLRWAADVESGAPYAFQEADNPSEIIGFEVDIIKAIAKELGMETQHIQNEWDGLIPGLDRKDYDLAINGIEITDDRKEVVNFSHPYYITFEQLVVRKDQNDIKALSELIGKRVGTLDGSVAERILKAKEGITVKAYDSEIKSYKDLEIDRLDAVLIDEPVAKYYAGWNPQLKLVGGPIGEVSYGIAMRKEDTTLLNNINAALDKLKKSGKLREILERWNMWNVTMAAYLNDESESNVPPKEYTKFIAKRLKHTGFFDVVKKYIGFMPLYLEASLVTLGLSIVSMILAIVVGLIVVLARVYGPKPISALAVAYIELIRGTPLLIQLFFIFYALPSIGIKITPYFAAILGLGLNYASCEAENYRAGLFSVPRGQMEAAISLGMTRNQALRHVILPQAIRIVIPPMTNDFIALLKDSSLVSVITIIELTKIYNNLGGATFDYIGTGLITAALYLIIGLPFVKLAKVAEAHFTVDKRKVIRR